MEFSQYMFFIVSTLWACRRSVAGTTPSEPEWKTEILKYAYGDDLKYSWVIPEYNKLRRLYLKVNDTYIYHIRYNTTLKNTNSPKIYCVMKLEKLSRICYTSIKPYSSVKDGKFNLVIKNLSMVLNNSTMHAIFDNQEGQNATSYIYIMIEPLPPTTTPCPPHKYPSVTTMCPVCPTLTPCKKSWLSCPCSCAQLQELQEDVEFYKNRFIFIIVLIVMVSIPYIIILIHFAKTCLSYVRKRGVMGLTDN